MSRKRRTARSPPLRNKKSRRNHFRRLPKGLLLDMALVAEGTDRFAVIGRLFGCSRFQAGDTVEWHEPGVFGFFLQHDLAVELHHVVVVETFLAQLFVALTDLFFARVLGDTQLVEIVLLAGGYGLGVQNKMMLGRRQRDGVIAGEDFVPPMLVVPLGERRGHVHFLDNVAPAYARVVG